MTLSRHMQRLPRLAAVALLLSAPPLPALDYQPTSLDRMLGLADVIVWGTVESVGPETFTATVHDTLGELAAGTDPIEIERYELYDHPGGRAEYEPGQSFVWLLIWGPDEAIADSPSRWRISGHEGEGELRADARCVFLPEGLVPELATGRRRVDGERRRAAELPRTRFWDAAAGYRRCVRWTPGTREAPPSAQTMCSPEELAKYAAHSLLHRHLAIAAGLGE